MVHITASHLLPMFHIINVKTLNATLSYHENKIKKAVFQLFVIKTETTSTRMITELSNETSEHRNL